MVNIAEPNQAIDYFFKSFMHNQCHLSWALFSDHSQKEFLKWALNDIYEKNPEAAKAAKLSEAEVKLLFEKNDPSMMKSFWKRFFYSSGANDFFRFGYYETIEDNGKQATVKVTFKYPDGRSASTQVKALRQKGGWRFAYLESGLSF